MTEKTVEKATFAGGCFWCMVKPFKEWDGIHDVVSGYMGGQVENPTYEDVKKGDSVFIPLGSGAKTLGVVVGKDERYNYVVTCAGAYLAVPSSAPERTNFTCDNFKNM